MTVPRMRFACWILEATDRHSECVILIAFPLQQSLQERASLLRYTYIAVLSYPKGFLGQSKTLFRTGLNVR